MKRFIFATLSFLFFVNLAFASQYIWNLTDEQRNSQWALFLNPILQRNVVEFQPFRAEVSGVFTDGTSFSLTSLNPYFNSWYVLVTGTGRNATAWHLENVAPDLFSVTLSENGQAIKIVSSQDSIECSSLMSDLQAARRSAIPYAPICEGRLYLRNQGSGSSTLRESVTSFLRDHVPFGEDLINLVKDTFYVDAFRQSSETNNPLEAFLFVDELGSAQLRSQSQNIGMRVQRAMPLYRVEDNTSIENNTMIAGRWYGVTDAPGIYASVIQPEMIHPDILNRRNERGLPEADAFEVEEQRADVYLFGYDLSRFEVRYELGTDHPEVGWSQRPSVDRRRLPGPDGFGSIRPLASTGMLSPVYLNRIAGIFTAGFKRQHGAFRFGPMSTSLNGHHYGFIVNGTVLSRLMPGLATIYTLDDGSFHMETWTEGHNNILPRIRYARQNGVPLVETDVNGVMKAGDFVKRRDWALGNWSGSAEERLRTLRSGACLQKVLGRSFLIYAVFSTATPSAMTRVFQSYGCEYAMLLDMNSEDLTYAAVYSRAPGQDQLNIHHLFPRMANSDHRGGRWRFVHAPDNRDFFYLLRTR